eukprot:jgi/Chlat1/2020/Chrsp158S00129
MLAGSSSFSTAAAAAPLTVPLSSFATFSHSLLRLTDSLSQRPLVVWVPAQHQQRRRWRPAVSQLAVDSSSSTASASAEAAALLRDAVPLQPPSTEADCPPAPSTSPSLNEVLGSPAFNRSVEAGSKLKVAVLLSGGVDSSVALGLLHSAGHECVAYYLKIWFQEDFRNTWAECPWEEDLRYAQAVCDSLGVDLRVVHLTDDYWNHVVQHSVGEIKAGRTPNPDVLCNSRVKFGAFFNHIDFNEFDRVASGHYAHISREDGVAHLELSVDEDKDQTYFLAHLSQEQLSRIMFPLGFLPKAQVRELASRWGFPTSARKDSQGICFLGKVKFPEFVAMHLGEKQGQLVECETGRVLGEHKGFWFYTIGQRQGLRLAHGPWYVVCKDTQNNVVYVSKNYYSGEKVRNMFRAGLFNWTLGERPKSFDSLRCKVRHGKDFHDCHLVFEKETAVVTLLDRDQGLSPGQYAVFYRGNVCLGSAVILEDVSGGAGQLCTPPTYVDYLPPVPDRRTRS